MIECHGWATIREAYREEDENEKRLDEAISIISSEIEKTGNRWDGVIKLFQLVADVAKGSYGLLHFHDDEADGEQANAFQVFVLKRGKIELSVEKHLSPYFPTLEDNSE